MGNSCVSGNSSEHQRPTTPVTSKRRQTLSSGGDDEGAVVSATSMLLPTSSRRHPHPQKKDTGDDAAAQQLSSCIATASTRWDTCPPLITHHCHHSVEQHSLHYVLTSTTTQQQRTERSNPVNGDKDRGDEVLVVHSAGNSEVVSWTDKQLPDDVHQQQDRHSAEYAKEAVVVEEIGAHHYEEEEDDVQRRRHHQHTVIHHNLNHHNNTQEATTPRRHSIDAIQSRHDSGTRTLQASDGVNSAQQTPILPAARRRQRSRSQQQGSNNNNAHHSGKQPTTPHHHVNAQGFRSVLVRAEGVGTGGASCHDKLLDGVDDFELPELMLMSASTVVGATNTTASSLLHPKSTYGSTSNATDITVQQQAIRPSNLFVIMTPRGGGSGDAAQFHPIGMPTPGSSVTSFTGGSEGLTLPSADAFGA